MRIDDLFPDPDDFIKCEKKTLIFLKDNVGNCLSKLASDAYIYYYQYNSSFDFESDFPINVNKKSGTAYIGATIRLNNRREYEDISYSLAICKNENARILRKFHFDYTLPDPSRRQPHPVFHIQYGGELSPIMQGLNKELNFEYKHLDINLSEPRLCYMPMSLALLINIIIKEFPNVDNSKLIEKPEWRDLVRKNEKIILAPYYRRCHNFLSNRSEKLFINDFYYAE